MHIIFFADYDNSHEIVSNNPYLNSMSIFGYGLLHQIFRLSWKFRSLSTKEVIHGCSFGDRLGGDFERNSPFTYDRTCEHVDRGGHTHSEGIA